MKKVKEVVSSVVLTDDDKEVMRELGLRRAPCKPEKEEFYRKRFAKALEKKLADDEIKRNGITYFLKFDDDAYKMPKPVVDLAWDLELVAASVEKKKLDKIKLGLAFKDYYMPNESWSRIDY